MSGRPKLLNINHKLARLFDPGQCQLCGCAIPPLAGFCADCHDAMQTVDHPCSLCGLVNQGSGSICPACLHRPPRWQRMIAPLVYRDETRDLIRQLKYNQQKPLARALVSRVIDHFRHSTVEMLLPVPMHNDRHLERGFNQAGEIARHFSRELNLPLDSRYLRRDRPTIAQSGLSLVQRRKNLRAAISCAGKTRHRRVALIDDIITSGATMEACCIALQRTGVEYIEVWALARTFKHG
jgi:ComF family protein